MKLLDFGLAKLRERDERSLTDPTRSEHLTEVGVIMGTVPYMSPEQIEGREVDARTDIVAFGTVLYEMVCGRRPFSGDSRASLMAAIVGAEPAPLAPLQPQIPASLERLIRRCLAKDPDDRWQTTRDLAAELRWIAGVGPSTTTPALPRPARRAAFLGGAVGAGLTAGIAAATAWFVWPDPSVPEYLPVTYRKGVVSSARFTPDGESIVYSASWDGQSYAAFLGRSEAADARDLQLKDARVLSIAKAGDMAVLFGPQNIEQAFGERTLARIPVAGGARRDLVTGVVDADWIPVHDARAAWSLRVSPDGSRVAFFEGPMLFGSAPQAMITVVERSGRKMTIARDWSGYGLAWEPSGREVWFTATRPALGAPSVHAVTLSGVERTVHRGPDWLVLHDIFVDGRVLLSRNTISIDLACKQPADIRERDLTWQFASSVRGLSRDGQTLIFEDELGAALSGNPLFRRSMDGSPAVPIGEGAGAALSPDGKWVLALFATTRCSGRPGRDRWSRCQRDHW